MAHRNNGDRHPHPMPHTHLHHLGAGVSMVCAIHCLAMPLLVGVFPMLGLSFLAQEATEAWLVGLTLTVSVAGGLWGFHRHRALRILMTIVGAASVLTIGRCLGEAHPLGLPLTLGGAVAIAVAHLWGARLCRTCPAQRTT